MSDRLDAYRFALRRQRDALLTGREPAGDDPIRRRWRALVSGAVLGSLALAATAGLHLAGHG